MHGSAQEPPPAADTLKQLSLEQLSQIEVTSVTKEAVPAFQTPAAISIITSEMIQHSGAHNILDLLRLVPGLDIAQIDSSEWAIGVRGFQDDLSKGVLVLIDGRSIYTPLFAGVYWDMHDVMLEDVDRIEVIRGPGGTIWGANAVNGVINIITKNARDTRGTFVSAGGGNVDQGLLTWRYGAGTDDLSYRVYGKMFTRGPQYHSDGDDWDDWRRGQIGFRIDSRPGSRDALTIQGDLYDGEAGQQLRVSTYNPPTNPIVEGNKQFNGENLMAAWRHVFSSGGDIQLRAYYDRTDREQANYREVRHTFDVDFIHHQPYGRHDFTWGAGARVSPSQYFQTAATVDFIPHKETYNIFSAFAQDEYALIPRKLALTIGSKFEHTTYSGFDAQPGIRLAWTPNRQHTVWAAVTRAVRTASRIEDGFRFSYLIQQEPPFYLRLIGDGEFTREQLIGYEAGYRRYITSRGFVGLTLFHNRYDDLLSVESPGAEVEETPPPTHLVLPIYFRNGVAANSSGGEISALWDIRKWWRARGSYSLMLLDAKNEPNHNDFSTVGQLEGDSPTHQVALLSSFALPKQFSLDLVYRYVGAVRDPEHPVPAYSTGDARLSRRLGEQFELEVVGRNLLQPSHLEYPGPAGPLVGIRRSVYVGLTWTMGR